MHLDDTRRNTHVNTACLYLYATPVAAETLDLRRGHHVLLNALRVAALHHAYAVILA